jgi:putative CocE/NonD family hydrolase
MFNENRWLAADSWPPAEARIVRWYLGSGGRANTRNGDGVLVKTVAPSDARDHFRYDPLDPAPSRGGPVCCTGNPHERPGPADQAEVESRDDVLVYTSAPLDEVLRIAGPLRAHFTVSSSATDTDLVTRLVHVRPDGKALGIQEGALRLRYRNGFGSPTLMEPGRRYDVVVDMRSIAYSIPKGHRLRLDVTSSSFPRLERNLNTGASNNADETRSVVAQNEIHHGANAMSFLELAVLPAEP